MTTLLELSVLIVCSIVNPDKLDLQIKQKTTSQNSRKYVKKILKIKQRSTCLLVVIHIFNLGLVNAKTWFFAYDDMFKENPKGVIISLILTITLDIVIPPILTSMFPLYIGYKLSELMGFFMCNWCKPDFNHDVKFKRDELKAVIALAKEADEINSMEEKILSSASNFCQLTVTDVMRKIDISNHKHTNSCPKECYRSIGTVKKGDILSPETICKYVSRGHAEIIVKDVENFCIGYLLLEEVSNGLQQLKVRPNHALAKLDVQNIALVLLMGSVIYFAHEAVAAL
ncbi:hypothetical protein QYM36_017838 [Artemia franciscana]|uniref:CNNM transmembrane domain-containing protein n=1 Tax=Artemia franciscana TaxID=6661 RepID=A0AA88KVG5_ARTSF|nr:hypothetical protein QYM36_017838 [Artemia franciscana]